MIWVGHPFGNANVRAVLRAFHERGMLDRFYTTFAFEEGAKNPLFPSKISHELNRRSYRIPSRLIHQSRWKEGLRQVALRCGLGRWSNSVGSPIGIDAVWRHIDEKMSFDLGKSAAPPQAIYAYEDGALQSFRAAKKLGVKCIYDQPIGYFESAQRIFAEDRERMPEFAGLLEGIRDPFEKLQRKKEEASLADVIISCSDFVTRTLVESGISKDKIREVQFGVPESISPKVWSPKDAQGPLKILFVGRVTQRKGIGYLLKAMKEIGPANVELHILGPISGNAKILESYRHLFHYHSPAPQSVLFDLMRRSHVLALPSLYEGQALVILEAMRIGLPVIITPNTGAGKIVKDGENGFIVPVGSADEIQKKIEWMLENRSSLFDMGESAYQRVLGMTWKSYEENIASIAHEWVKGGHS